VTLTLDVTDQWNFDEDIGYFNSPSFKNVSSWAVGGFVGFGAWWNVKSVPVSGSITVNR
jgi:hypothetical protein